MEKYIFFIILYFILLYIVFSVSMYFIFKKTYIKPIYSLIPLVNFYYYYKICKLSWMFLLIPGINIVILFFTPYRLGYEFDQTSLSKTFGVMFPIVYFPYIAFSNARYIHRKHSNLNLNSISDIEKLDNDIQKKIQIEEYANNSVTKNNKKSSKKQIENYDDSINNYISNIESKAKAFDDEYIADEQIYSTPKLEEKPIIIVSDEFIEINDDVAISDNLDIVEKIDNLGNSIKANSDMYIDKAEYKEIEEKKQSVEQIAFNNNNNEINYKESNTTLKCPDCGSNLIGFHDFCPGCNRDIRNIMNE